jgi:signal transduction histidine kinase/ActR/RegA family two-component response regulator
VDAGPRGDTDFPHLLARRLDESGEDTLVAAYGAGRLALESGASFLDLIGTFGDALIGRLAADPTAPAADVVRSAVEIFREAAAPFQMTIEGYRRAIADLEQAKEELEDRVRERTAELEAAKSVAEAASNAKSEFVSRMSHELRTPLNAVLGFAQLLSLDNLTVEQQEAVSDILRAGRHLLELINEVLDLARIEAGRLPLSMQPLRVADVVTECLALLTPFAAQHDVSLRMVAASDREVHVRADRQRLAQVVINLVSNAVKYNRPAGAVTIGWELHPPEKVRLVVQDTGVGIAGPLLARLFHPFERLEADPSIEGTGLGLALSRRLVDAMGGGIGVESEAGRGSTFWVDLVADSAPDSGIGESEAAHRSEPVLPAPVEVLYVEDNESNVRLVERFLGRLSGVALLAAGTGSAGLELATRHRPGLILLDMHLPDMSGEDVLACLRRDPRTQEIPVVGVSADATPERRRSVLAAGAAGYLTKPLDLPAFLATVADLLVDIPPSP